MADSYEKRIAMAERQLDEALRRRDSAYPGSPAWNREQAKAQEWQRLIEDLRAASA